MAQRTRSDSPTKMCGLDDCDRPLRARGLCATHYNQTRPDRHVKHNTLCVVCGITVKRRRSEGRRATCSVACRAIVQYGQHAPTDPHVWRHSVRYRVRAAGCEIVEEFDREEIFDRDDWLCYLCGITCTTPDPFVLTAATIDHIVALSLGGVHSRANVATCCLLCNSTRQAGARAA